MTHPLLNAIQANDLPGFERALHALRYQPGGLDQVQWLVAEEGHSPTTLAASLNRVDMLRAMAAAGVDMGLVDGRSMTPLHEAAAQGHAAAVRELLKDRWLDRDPRASRETPLHLAADGGHVAAIEALIDGGANPSAEGVFGNHPVHYAARGGHVDTLRVLHANGCSLGLRNGNGDTPAHLAAAENQPGAIAEIARLAGVGALVLQDKDGNQALHVAASVGYPDVVRALAAAGVPPDAPNRHGLTAAQAAATPLDRQMAQKPIAPMFEETGGNPAQVLDVLSEFGVAVPQRPPPAPVGETRPQWQILLTEAAAKPAQPAATAAPAVPGAVR